MINKHAIVETQSIGKNVQIGEFAIIRSGAVLGDGVVIHPHVVIEAGVRLGEGVEVFPFTYIGKVPKGAGATARPLTYQPYVDIGPYCVIGPHAVLYQDLVIGQHTLIADGAYIREQSKIGSYCVIGKSVGINYNTRVGDRTRIMGKSVLCGNMSVGDDVFISVGVMTANDNTFGAEGYNEDKITGPTICNFAQIGVGAILLPGITIGEHAVVAAGAVVTKDVAPYEVVMGIPGKVVKILDRSEPGDMQS